MSGLIVLVVPAAIVTWAVLTYNRLVSLRNRVDSAWAQIDVQLTRRHDLVPNLVDTVKGYAAHERDTLDRVVRARNSAVAAAGPAGRARAEEALSTTLTSLFALSERYPELKANQNFVALQEELTATEDRVAYSRQFFNTSVQTLNTTIETFPGVLLATKAKATHREYFEVEAADRAGVRGRF